MIEKIICESQRNLVALRRTSYSLHLYGAIRQRTSPAARSERPKLYYRCSAK